MKKSTRLNKPDYAHNYLLTRHNGIWSVDLDSDLTFKVNMNDKAFHFADQGMPLHLGRANVTGSNDLFYWVGTTGNAIEWKIVDTTYFNPTYQIMRNNIPITSLMSWESGAEVPVDVDGLSAGGYNYTIIVDDHIEGIVKDTIFVTVVLSIPPVISTPSNTHNYDVNTTGNFLSWIITDASISNTSYTIFKDGAQQTTPVSWTSGTNVSYNVDGLPMGGPYNFTIIVDDGIGGNARSTVLVKVDPPTIKAWSQLTVDGNWHDYVTDIDSDGDNIYQAVGIANTSTRVEKRNSTDGSILMSASLGPAGPYTSPTMYEYFSPRIAATASNIYLGFNQMTTNNWSIFHVLNAQGNSIYQYSNNIYAGVGPKPINALCTDRNGVYLLSCAGTVYKYSLSGQFLFAFEVAGMAPPWQMNDDYGMDIISNPTENAVYLTGYKNDGSAGGYDVVIQKFTTGGKSQWFKMWGGSNDDKGFKLAIDGNALYVAGTTKSFGGTIKVFILKYTLDGNLLWNTTVETGLTTADRINPAIAVKDGRVFLCAQVGTMSFVAKYNAAGKQQWLRNASLGTVITAGNEPGTFFVSGYQKDLLEPSKYSWYLEKYQFNDKPVISHIEDRTVEWNSVGNVLSWSVTDAGNSAPYYWIYRNGTQIDSGTWVQNMKINISIDGLALDNNYNYTIKYADGLGERTEDQTVIEVRNVPPRVTSPPDQTYHYCIADKQVNWTITDSSISSATFTVYKDGVVNQSGAWTSGMQVLVNTTRSPSGIYNYTIIVTDGFGPAIQDTVFVTVLNNLPNITNPLDMSFFYGTTGHSINWTIFDDSVLTTNYTIQRSGVMMDSGTWGNGSQINTSIDGLGIGFYTYTITVQDGYAGGITQDTVRVTVVNTDLDIQGSENTVIEYQTINHSLSWFVIDNSVSTTWFTILRDGTTVRNGVWTSEVPVIESIDGLGIGSHQYTFIAEDGMGNALKHQVNVTVVNLQPTSTSPADLVFIHNTLAHVITWTISDSSTDSTSYTAYWNGTTFYSGSWTSGSAIAVNVEDLPLGIHNLTIIASDGLGGMVQDMVLVTVLNAAPAISHGPSVIYYHTTIGHSLNWTLTDASMNITAAIYVIFKDSITIANGTWVNGTVVSLNITGLDIGVYDYLIVVFDGLDEYSLDEVTVSVINVEPSLSVLDDIYIEGSVVDDLALWTITDPDTFTPMYEIYANDTIVVNASWVPGNTIRVSTNGLAAATYNYSIIVYDGLGGIVNSSVLIHVESAFHQAWNTTWIAGHPQFVDMATDGTSVYYLAKGSSSTALTKCNAADGEIVWNKIIPMVAYSICINGSALYIAGANVSDSCLAKYDSDGVLIWSRTLVRPDSDGALDVDVEGAFAYIVGNDGNVYVAKYNASGDLEWVMGSVVPFASGFGIDVSGGMIYITGVCYQDSNAFVARIDDGVGNGTLAWVKHWGGTGNDVANGVAVGGGIVYITGITATMGIFVNDVFVASFDTDGNSVFNQTCGDSPNEAGKGIVYAQGRAWIGCSMGTGGSARAAFYSCDASGIMHVFHDWKAPLGEYSTNLAAIAVYDGDIYIAGYNISQSDYTEHMFIVKFTQNMLPVVSSVADITFASGTNGNVGNWTVTDASIINPVFKLIVDGTTFISGTWSSGASLIINLDSILVGNHTCRLIVNDGYNGIAIDDFLVNVTNVAPSILPPLDIQCFQAQEGCNITWTAIDSSTILSSYIVYRNGTIVASGTWTSGMPIVFLLDDLQVGVFNFTILLDDGYSGTALDEVLVTILNDAPIITGNTGGVTFLYSDTGRVITWNVNDTSVFNASFKILVNGTSALNGTWWHGTPICFNVDSFPVGRSNISLQVLDGYGGFKSFDLNLTIINPAPVIYGTGDMLFKRDSTGHVISWKVNDATTSTPTYQVYQNGTEIGNGTWYSGSLIVLNVDGISIGIHNFTIVAHDGIGGMSMNSVLVDVYQCVILNSGNITLEYNPDHQYPNTTITWWIYDRIFPSNTNAWFSYDGSSGTFVYLLLEGSGIPVVLIRNYLSGEPGVHYITMQYWDAYGDVYTDYVFITITNTPPIISSPPDITVTYSAAIWGQTRINWTLTDPSFEPGSWYGGANYSITINGSVMCLGSWGSPTVNLSVSFGFLNPGYHNIRLTVNDGFGGASTDDVLLTIFNVPPVISQPPDMNVEYRTDGYSRITWLVYSNMPSNNRTYRLYDNGSLVLSGSWYCGEYVVSPILNNWSVGMHNVTIIFSDGGMYGSNDSVLVTIADIHLDVQPSTDSIECLWGSTGYNFSWTITDYEYDTSSARYYVTARQYHSFWTDEFLVFNDISWISGTVVTVELDTLPHVKITGGEWIFTIMVYEWGMHYYNNISVTIIDIQTSLSNPPDVTYEYGHAGNTITWQISDTTLDPTFSNNFFVDLDDGLNVIRLTGYPSDGLEDYGNYYWGRNTTWISVNIDGLLPGDYRLSLSLAGGRMAGANYSYFDSRFGYACVVAYDEVIIHVDGPSFYPETITLMWISIPAIGFAIVVLFIFLHKNKVFKAIAFRLRGLKRQLRRKTGGTP
jgi:hypothetical protein